MANIQNRTARRLMYEWHSGGGSPFYAAASSGLVASFVALADECARIDDAKDRQALMIWIQRRQPKAPRVVVHGREYAVLPWVSRSYFGDTSGRRAAA